MANRLEWRNDMPISIVVMSKQVKVLVSGEVNGRFQSLIKRVSSVNQKSGPFDLLFCVGEFFGDDEATNHRVLSGELSFPVPTYILGACSESRIGCYPSSSGVELSPSVTFLGKKGLLNTATGLSIAYLSGVEGNAADGCHFNGEIVEELLVPVKASPAFIGVDVLLTSQWPNQVTKFAPNTPIEEPEGSDLVGKVAAALKPRYHFAGMSVHYERAPYRNHRILLEAAQQTTRFVGLSAVDSSTKWLYAFNIQPLRHLNRAQLTEQPQNASEFPYMQLLGSLILRDQETRASMAGEKRQYFFDTTSTDEVTMEPGAKRSQHGSRNGHQHQQQQRPPQPCWFCLSNEGAEKQLVISVGNHCYLALAKGPLCPEHVLILPIEHTQSLVSASPGVRQEAKRYREALARMLAPRVIVCFERNYRSQHAQIQIVPIPESCASTLKDTFLDVGKARGFELNELGPNDEVWDLVNEGCPYFVVQLPDDSKLFTRQMAGFPLQFGREVLASKAVLNVEGKVDWRSCEMGKDEELQLVHDLVKMFEPFDFTDESPAIAE